jgi:hypothetical protein
MRTSQADELGHSGPRDALAFATGTSTPVNERPTSSPAGNFSSRYAYWADDLDHRARSPSTTRQGRSLHTAFRSGGSATNRRPAKKDASQPDALKELEGAETAW